MLLLLLIEMEKLIRVNDNSSSTSKRFTTCQIFALSLWVWKHADDGCGALGDDSGDGGVGGGMTMTMNGLLANATRLY
jgi:hypothetical protein